MKATGGGGTGGVQNSYMDYYKFFRPTPGDKYWLVPNSKQNKFPLDLPRIFTVIFNPYNSNPDNSNPR